MTTPTNEPMTAQEILEAFRRVVWNSGWNSPSDEALAEAIAQINALRLRDRFDELETLLVNAYAAEEEVISLGVIKSRIAELEQLLQKGEK